MDNADELKDLYADTARRIDTILTRGNADFWLALRNAIPSGLSPAEIIAYALNEFGVVLKLNETGLGFIPKAEVVDEQKYLVFLLKYQK